MDNAKIFAENVIRNRKEALNLKRLGVKMGALSAKLESAYRTQQISETISKTVPMLQHCMKQMDTMGVSPCVWGERVSPVYRLTPALASLRRCSRTWM
jgi:hypothetical protein